MRPVLIHSFLAVAMFAAGLRAADAASAAIPPGGIKSERYPLEDYLTGIAEQQWRNRAEQIAKIKTAADVEGRIKFIRAEFLKAIGGLPGQRAPLNARITGTLERKGYRIEKLIYESLPGCFVTANLYVPTTGPGPFPAVLGAAGHSFPEGKATAVYQAGFIALASRGYVVLAYDPPGQGERVELNNPGVRGAGWVDHISPGLQCLLTGGTSARYFMWDGIRGLDYLLTRPEVDPRRIAAAGNSGGGTQSAFLAVCEPRLAAVAPSCYWTSWEALWRSIGPQDSEQVLTNSIKTGLDFSDLVVAFAPKPILMLTATRDMFPIAGARTMHAEARSLFARLGAGEQCGYFEFDDVHAWSKPRREATVAWFDRWLGERTGPAPEPDIPPEAVAALRCTETGNVTSLNSKTTQKLNEELADTLYPRRTLPTIRSAAKAREVIAARLAIPVTRTKGAAKIVERTMRPGLSLETVTLVPEPGIELKLQLAIPAGPATHRPAVVVCRDDGLSADFARDAELAGWTKAGHVVVVAQLRGILTPPEKKTFYTTVFKTAMRAVLVGKTMAGMRVQDLLAVYDYTAARSEVASARIAVVGQGTMGVIALYAAALEPGIERVVASRSLISYMDLVRGRVCPELLSDVVVPGALLDFDLPDLAAGTGGNRVVLVNPTGVDGQAVSEQWAQSTYGKNARVVLTASTITPELVNGSR